ncbi:FAD binding domain-containing protein [Lutimaribacter sp. EGI FJ00015]|uniref:FAD binding domain-containing protein n=1 Tax=Lutimaribacter degradans TaxID=2945989 RepID=A0ACC5ZX50_9RHOB|nr:FAD binding domain-containing protein [Lutimaribacter sp. EGI FJ00013]MCM2562632.1 FAD binding domain-containing protein [Lutimaribacter sp. EGI FJ00013]MCO0613789.1 FAD binding domain-containing protein [Lutimaribacter sp. EGI FJ00015]MCO0636728.1 FAD binding domain-containing protein [Lutimaribacter sp. EGI FJ00014]
MGFHRPDRIEDALAALASGASVIAGGTDWYPSRGDGPVPMNVLDVTRLQGFRGITRDGAGWRIGAATTWTDIARADLPPAFDGLKRAAREVGGLQIQNAGTLGGNLCNASPAADGMPPLLTLDPKVELIGPHGAREVPLADFVTGPRQADLREGELLAALHIPDPGPSAGGFIKLGARKYLVISIAMVAALVHVEGGRVAWARVAVGACSPVARRLSALEADLQGVAVNALAGAVRPDHLKDLSPIGDVRGSAGYRLDAVAELVGRAIAQAARGA